MSTPLSSSTKLGVMLESGRLRGSMRFGNAAAQPKGVRHIGPQAEIVHFVVEQHARAAWNDSGTEQQIDRDRCRNAITFAVHNRQMRRVVAFDAVVSTDSSASLRVACVRSMSAARLRA